MEQEGRNKTKMKILVVGEACNAIFWPNSDWFEMEKYLSVPGFQQRGLLISAADLVGRGLGGGGGEDQ